MINEVEFLKNNNMTVIFVKDKQEVVEACELLEKIGINVLKDYKTYQEYLEADTHVENNYLIHDDEGWRIQSHFISDDYGIKELRQSVKNILTHPEFKQDMVLEEILVELADIGDRIYRLKKKIKKLKTKQ